MTQVHDDPRETISDGTLWVEGEFLLRIRGGGPGPNRTVRIDRPFAVVGFGPDADVRIYDRGVAALHAYLHLDRRGLYVIDLLSRGGTLVSTTGEMAGWLAPGDHFEVAGTRVELLRIELDGHPVSPSPCDEDPLAPVEPGGLIPVRLEPEAGRDADLPWDLGSELIFVGRAPGCGITLKDESASRIQGAFFRTPTDAYYVDLSSQSPYTNGERFRRATRLEPGHRLAFGSHSYVVQVEPALHEVDEPELPEFPPRPGATPTPSPASSEPPAPEPTEAPALVARVIHPEVEQFRGQFDDEGTLNGHANGQAGATGGHANGTELAVPEARDALLAWMVETVRDSKNQNAELQRTLGLLLQKIQDDNARLMEAHLSRLEAMDREISALRSELSRQAGQIATDAKSIAALPPPPLAPPLRIPRPAESHPTPDDSAASANWLLDRVSQLEEFDPVKRSAWKEWLGQFTASRR